MFSMTTMASSTTKPVETVSAIVEVVEAVTRRPAFTANVPVNDSGMAMPEITVGQRRRTKMYITATTRPMAIMSVIWTSLTDARIVPVRSFMTFEFHSRRQPFAKLWQQSTGPGRSMLTTFDAGLLENNEEDSALPVEGPGLEIIFLPINHLADVVKRHSDAVVLRDR